MTGRASVPVRYSLICVLAAGVALTVSGCTLGSFANYNGSGNNNNSGNSNSSPSPGSLTFSTPVNISSSHVSGRCATTGEWNFRIDDLGNLHLLWEEADSVGNDRQVMYARKPYGGSWSTPVKLSQASVTEPLYVGSARFDVHAASGNVYAVWQQGLGSSAKVWLNHNRGGGFGTPAVVSSTSPLAANSPGVRVDAADNVHMVWTQQGGSPLHWTVVYRGMFGGALDSSTADVSNRGSAHSTDDSLAFPTGLTLLPAGSSGAQAVGVLYLATANGATYALYAERSAGSSGSFGDIRDVSLESGAHLNGSIDQAPYLLGNAQSDLVALWTRSVPSAPTVIRANPRPSGGNFQSNSGNLTRASVGTSANATCPMDLVGRPVLDTSGGLHLFWEYLPGTGAGTYYHRYFAPIGVDPTTITETQVAQTDALTSGHQLRAALDLVDDLHVAWEQEIGGLARDIFYRRRTSGTAGTFDSSSLRVTTTNDDSQLRSLAVTGAGRAFILFDEATGPVTYIAVRETGGQLTGPVNLSRSPSLPCKGIVVRLDAYGTAHTLWYATYNASQSDIMYSSGS